LSSEEMSQHRTDEDSFD